MLMFPWVNFFFQLNIKKHFKSEAQWLGKLTRKTVNLG